MPKLTILLPVLSVLGAIGVYFFFGQATWWMALAFFGIPILGTALSFLTHQVRTKPDRFSRRPEKPFHNGARDSSERDF